MTDYKIASDLISSSLSLSSAPVAIAFCNELPEGIPEFDGLVAAGCQFWELAGRKVFATSAKDHRLCSIGIHTHNIAGAPETQETELITTLKVMMTLDYVRDDEVPKIPANKNTSAYVIYGPLDSFPCTADVVVVFSNSRQGLVISEAAERVDGATPLAMGRPACAAIPQVINSGNATLSLGCCGARAYIDALTDMTSLWVFPIDKLSKYIEQIAILGSANETLNTFHQRRKLDVLSGEEPSVASSLERM